MAFLVFDVINDFIQLRNTHAEGTVRETQPSLRDLCNRQFEPGSELPGYSQISLRKAETVKMSKLQRTTFQSPVRTAGWKARRTGSLERLPYTRTAVRG